MKHWLLTWLVCWCGSTLQAQGTTQIIVIGLLKTDRTFHKGEELLLETRVSRDQVIYEYDSSKAQFRVKECVSDRGCNIWDGEHTVKEKRKTRTPHFSNRVPLDEMQQFLADLSTHVDSLPVNDYHLHTSHYYLNVFVEVVIDGDTTTWHKSQPFERATPWHSDKGTFLNPAIDLFISSLLPKKFIGRDVMANPRMPESDPTSMRSAEFRVRVRSGKPAGL